MAREDSGVSCSVQFACFRALNLGKDNYRFIPAFVVQKDAIVG